MAKRRRIELENDCSDFEHYSNLSYGRSCAEPERDTEQQVESDSESENYANSESDSDSENDTEIDIETYVQSFRFKLRKWAVKNNITLMALTFLLKLLREEGFQWLPKDGRTLLRTPRTVEVSDIGEGKFWYRSLKEKLKQICKKRKCPTLLELGIHCDGFPPFKSSKLEFWPIQCWIKGLQMRPFFVGLYFGYSKPSSLELFLRPLLNDLHDLLQNGLKVKVNGIITNFVVKIHMLIFDAPARAFLKCIVGHSGYFSCEKCEEEGEYLIQPEKETNEENPGKTKKNPKKKSGHVCLTGTDAPIRTDESFRAQSQEEHHHGKSPLEELPIDMVNDIPREYQHLICQGMMKKLMLYWINGTKNYKTKFSALDIKQISKKLIKSRETKPSEINRPSRPLNTVGFWKATEFRTFLFKLGPVVLREHLSGEAYNHFLALFCAVTICSCKDLLPYTDVATKLFKDFVLRFGETYGNENYCYTVHNLIHVTDDVKRYGVLDDYSAFKGESNLAYLKRLIRGGYKPLQQIVKRIMELEMVEDFEEIIPKKEMELKKNILTLKDIRLDSSEKNRWILTKDRNIFKINNFSQHRDGKIQIHGVFLDKNKQKDLFDVPIRSSKLSIYVSALSEKQKVTINLDSMYCKLWKIPLSAEEFEEEFAFFPLFHFTQ